MGQALGEPMSDRLEITKNELFVTENLLLRAIWLYIHIPTKLLYKEKDVNV